MQQINIERLQTRLSELAKIGRREDGGLYRMCFTEEDIQAREWLKQQFSDAGLVVSEDGAANISGRLEVGMSSEPAVMTGSHIDTVPGGGSLDGALGVLAGLEALQSLKESGVALKRPLEVISFTDEEGRFGGMLGSRAFSGKLSPGDILNAESLDGEKLQDVMRQVGYEPLDALKAVRSAEALCAFVELHIEQGPVLERKKIPIGIVDGIAGLFKWTVRFIGVANHSGTTPMPMRVDALHGVAELIGEVQRILDENGSARSVSNIGRIEAFPGAANVVPGRVDFILEVRDPDPQVLGDLAFAFRKAMAAIATRRGLMFEFEVLSEIAPVECSPGVVQTIEGVASELGLGFERMVSGAAHDTQNMTDLARTAMIFVPSKDGKSHCPDEWTDWADIEAGSNVLLNTLLRLACE